MLKIQPNFVGPVLRMVLVAKKPMISYGLEPGVGASILGAPKQQSHRVLELKLEGMSGMGFVEAKMEGWHNIAGVDLPRDIRWLDVAITQEDVIREFAKSEVAQEFDWWTAGEGPASRLVD